MHRSCPPASRAATPIVAIQDEFPRGEITPITILADGRRRPGDARKRARPRRSTRPPCATPTASTASKGPFSLTNPATGQPLTPEEIAAIYAAPADQRPAGLDLLLQQYVRGSTVRFDAISPLEPATPAATEMIPVLRALDAGDAVTAEVGGAAALGHDFLASQAERLPYAVAVTLLASGVVLFLLFGSVVIPIKAIIMTLLSISASFGALVWIFQEGNFSNILGFDPIGFTIAGNPVIMFSVIFGLSMDYEVLLLSRIQEAYRRTGDNAASVAEGLAKTAGVITGAALIMVVVFAAFALAEVVTIKSIGVGMAIAVLIDATIIRVLLVPATMRLMGRWNWWAPGPLGRLAERLGFSHTEDADELRAPASAGAEPVAGLAPSR